MPFMALHLSPKEDLRRRALDTVMRALDITDAEMATMIGMSRSAIQQRRRGGVKLREEQADEMADALGVPRDLFVATPAEVLVWLANNQRERVMAASGWFGRNPGQRAA